MSIKSPQDLASEVTELASFPDIAIKINNMVGDENYGANEIGAVIKTDPALTAAMLKLANSVTYNVGGTVTNIERAITVVGLREVRDLAFGISATGSFDGIPNELISVEEFWKHSLYCATAAQYLAKALKIRSPDSIFTAGLLHDIGHLVMFSKAPDLSRKALELSLEENDGLSPYYAEKTIFGFTHADVGAALAEQWQFPDSLKDGIRYHHDPYESDSVTDNIIIIHIANSIAVLCELDSVDLDDAPPIDKRAIEAFDIQEDLLLETVSAATEMTSELDSIFIN